MTESPLPPSPDDSDIGWDDPAYDEESPDDAAARRLNDDRPPHHDRD